MFVVDQYTINPAGKFTPMYRKNTGMAYSMIFCCCWLWPGGEARIICFCW